METRQKTALIIATPGNLRDGLQVLLTAMPQLEIVTVVDNSGAAWSVITNQLPTIVLIDFDNDSEQTMDLLSRIKAHWPQVACLVLTDEIPFSISQADQVLLLRKGMAAPALFEAIAHFIGLSEGRHPLPSHPATSIKNNLTQA